MSEAQPPLELRSARVSPHVAEYLRDVAAALAPPEGPLVSLVLFGSAATGGYAAEVSDVDLVLVLRDGCSAEERRRAAAVTSELELRHGLAKPRRPGIGRLEAFADRITANVRAFFVCTRADLLSGEPARILGIPAAQARFVDRVAIPSIVGSGVTVWGEELLERVPLPPIRRVDVAKAWFSLSNQVLFSAAVYPFLPGATRYAMDALKRSVHNCYFCHHLRAAPLAEEVAFFARNRGPSRALAELTALRKEPRPSLGFVFRALPALARLHLGTARELRFPRHPRAAPGTGTSAVPPHADAP